MLKPREIAGVKLWELSEITRRLGVDHETLLRKIRKGELRAQRVGRRYRVAEENLRAWLLSRGTKPTKGKGR